MVLPIQVARLLSYALAWLLETIAIAWLSTRWRIEHLVKGVDVLQILLRISVNFDEGLEAALLVDGPVAVPAVLVHLVDHLHWFIITILEIADIIRIRRHVLAEVVEDRRELLIDRLPFLHGRLLAALFLLCVKVQIAVTCARVLLRWCRVRLAGLTLPLIAALVAKVVTAAWVRLVGTIRLGLVLRLLTFRRVHYYFFLHCFLIMFHMRFYGVSRTIIFLTGNRAKRLSRFFRRGDDNCTDLPEHVVALVVAALPVRWWDWRLLVSFLFIAIMYRIELQLCLLGRRLLVVECLLLIIEHLSWSARD